MLELSLATLVTFAVGLVSHRLGIRLAFRYKILDIPSSRKRHKGQIPINGGVCIFVAWWVGVGIYSALKPGWLTENLQTLAVISTSLTILLVTGLIDDTRGLSPKLKLFLQTLAATITVAFHPHLHAACLAAEKHIGIVTWPLSVFWIVGITNAVNLIDGLDGLAGGTSLLVSTSIVCLCQLSGGFGSFTFISMALLIPATLSFLKYNWNPAKIFLGDNGSLTLGFMIATSSVVSMPARHFGILMASIIVMLGYPILDMGLATLRRAQKRLPLFKADRNHLHFRIQRLGLTTRQTAVVLLSISLYLQITSVCVNFMTPFAGAMGLSMVTFSIFTLIMIVRSIEQSRVKRIQTRSLPENVIQANFNKKGPNENWAVRIELNPLYEVAMHEENIRYSEVVLAMYNFLSAISHRTGEPKPPIAFGDGYIFITLNEDVENPKAIGKWYHKKVNEFCQLIDFQSALSSIPVSVKKTRKKVTAPVNKSA